MSELRYRPDWIMTGLNFGILAVFGLWVSQVTITADSMVRDVTPVLFAAVAGTCLYDISKEACRCIRSARCRGGRALMPYEVAFYALGRPRRIAFEAADDLAARREGLKRVREFDERRDPQTILHYCISQASAGRGEIASGRLMGKFVFLDPEEYFLMSEEAQASAGPAAPTTQQRRLTK